MYFLESNDFSTPDLNTFCVKVDKNIHSRQIFYSLYTLASVQRMLNSLVNNVSIWQSEHGKKSM